MSIPQTRVDLFKVTNSVLRLPSKNSNSFLTRTDQKSIAAAANTINRSFSRDPLIQWLRPNGLAWECLDAQTCKWQRRRIQQALCQGIVLQSACVQEIREKMAVLSKANPPRLKTPAVDAAALDITNGERKKEAPECLDSGAVIILFPPKKHIKWSFSRLMLACKVWLLDWIDPATDKGTDSSVSEQAQIFFKFGFK
jgi:hypothetical protein